jgi:hypothetical protein
MPDFLSQIDGPALFMMLVFVPLAVALAVVIPLGLVLTMRQQRIALDREHALKQQENALKREMLAKGHSAEEIERVIRATGDAAAAKPPATVPANDHRNGADFDKTRLIAVLVENGVDADGIEVILHAVADANGDELTARVTAIANMVENGMEAADIERVIRALHRSPQYADVPPPSGQTAFRE